MQFQFATATSIHFGAGIAKSIASLLPDELGQIFVITGASPFRNRAILDLLERNGYPLELYSVSGEPTLDSVNAATEAARKSDAQAIIAIGGGSVIDTGKAVAALLPNRGNLLDYLEGVGKGRALTLPSLPFMAVPTTAGTGSEVTKNSVIGVPEAGVKVSLRSDFMLPRWAVVDPELTYGLSGEVAAYTGMDALIQCLEAYLSRFSNPLTDGIAREGLRRAARSLRSACSSSLDADAKSDLCMASLCGGIALANAKLGSVHGFAGPLGGMIPAPHGAICASLLTECFKANMNALATREPRNPSLEKMRDLATLITGNPEAKASYALAWFDALFNELPLKRLGKLGLTADRISEAARKAGSSSSMKGNPIELSRFELEEILENAL
ncbi:iron-containing alcohol dehydrogenase [Pelagicoccus sp. SDUM812003]|uniref:iron-containing alcohol dehydrogenase n=1 Tax=Pelagicoccus sp. SDUM812003 TaxID=3041267 RepID=UPI00280F7931|nr:iron-containing alcohol dehydrogenase [Pelagicoccus sp. SDUM812003]MDQ8202040.1 iron-containing alcohol dehydrogenase [Pelagicoccus sp. SDUM812003]